jgi:hypothetical protein
MVETSVKVSDITVKDIADYLRISDLSTEDTNFLTKCLTIAKDYIKSYTGVEDLDQHSEFVICVHLLCQDMYDNRALYQDSEPRPNRTFETILNLYNGNLI